MKEKSVRRSGGPVVPVCTERPLGTIGDEFEPTVFVMVTANTYSIERSRVSGLSDRPLDMQEGASGNVCLLRNRADDLARPTSVGMRFGNPVGRTASISFQETFLNAQKKLRRIWEDTSVWPEPDESAA